MRQATQLGAARFRCGVRPPCKYTVCRKQFTATASQPAAAYSRLKQSGSIMAEPHVELGGVPCQTRTCRAARHGAGRQYSQVPHKGHSSTASSMQCMVAGGAQPWGSQRSLGIGGELQFVSARDHGPWVLHRCRFKLLYSLGGSVCACSGCSVVGCVWGWLWQAVRCPWLTHPPSSLPASARLLHPAGHHHHQYMCLTYAHATHDALPLLDFILLLYILHHVTPATC